MARPPRRGSLLEVLLILVQIRREAAEMFQLHTMVQAILNADAKDSDVVQKAFKNYTNAKAPFLKEAAAKEESVLKEHMAAWTKVGPLQVAPSGTADIVSHLTGVTNVVRDMSTMRGTVHRRPIRGGK